MIEGPHRPGLLALLIVILAALVLLPSAALARVVDSVEVTRSADGVDLRAEFSVPVQLLGQSPEGPSQVFEIRLRPSGQGNWRENATLAFDAKAGAPIESITYEGLGRETPVLILRASRPIALKAAMTGRQTLRLSVAAAAAAPRIETHIPMSEKMTGSLPAGAAKAEAESPLMHEATGAMLDGKFERAIQLFTKLTREGSPAERMRAQELLGLARERNGQDAQAKAEYETYLKIYPDGPGADRVRQRLTAMVTAALPGRPAAARRLPQKEESDAWRTDFYGGFSQSYYRTGLHPSGGPSQTLRSNLTSDLDATLRARNDAWDIRGQVSGSFDKDLLNSGSNDQTRIYTLAFDVKGLKNGFYGRVGRQSHNGDGVFGRIDGVYASYAVMPWVTVGGLYGYPVERTRDDLVNDKRRLYGGNIDFGGGTRPWTLGAYFVKQDSAGLTDRQAVGSEFEYFDPKLSAYGLVDYDLHFGEINIAMAHLNWTATSGTAVALALDYRKSPFLTTTNAIIGQGVEDLSQLTGTYTEDQLYTFAQDRTAESRSASLGLTQDVNDHLQFTADLTASSFSGTVSSGGVEGFDGTGTNLYLVTQLIATDLLFKDDIAIGGLRFVRTGNYTSYGLILNERMQILHGFRINPRVWFDYRKSSQTSDTRLTVRPHLRMEYRLKRWLSLEFEGGLEWTNLDALGFSQTQTIDFLYFGYRASF